MGRAVVALIDRFNTTVPVVVVYRGGIGVLAMARSLGRLGIPVYLIAEKGTDSPVTQSRYWRRKWWCDFSVPPEQIVDFFLLIGRQFETKPILLTFADWVAILIEEHADELQQAFRFPRAQTPVIRRLADKWEMYLLAKQLGVPVPETARPQSRDDVLAFLQNARFPVVIKDADAYLIQQISKEIVHTPEDVLDRFDRAAARGTPNLILQEYIPGETQSGWMCNGYFGRESQCHAIFTANKIRQVNATGICSIAVVLPNPEVMEQTQRLMQGVGYQGACGVGYRYDVRDGKYKIHDINPRVSGVLRLFCASNGMDVARICYLDLTGQPIPPSTVPAGRKWMLEDDIFSAIQAARAGKLTFVGWLKSLWGVKETHWFAFDDPAPGAAWFAGTVWPVIVSSLRKLRAQSFEEKRKRPLGAQQ
jgi:predicted ATP-grasp superfamily ATP-dependent carboligase